MVFLVREEYTWIYECLAEDAKELADALAETGPDEVRPRLSSLVTCVAVTDGLPSASSAPGGELGRGREAVPGRGQDGGEPQDHRDHPQAGPDASPWGRGQDAGRADLHRS
ncbi:hypothetical protein GCM10027074_35690 [Streptomyces deserti]